MLDKLGILLFGSFCIFLVYMHKNSEVKIYQCNKPKTTPYFVGTSNNFKILKGKVKYLEEKDCTIQKMTRGEWYVIKNAFKNTKGIQ